MKATTKNIDAATVIKWLKERPLISLNQLEKAAKVPQSTLSKAIKGRMPLAEHHVQKLVKVLKWYGLTN